MAETLLSGDPLAMHAASRMEWQVRVNKRTMKNLDRVTGWIVDFEQAKNPAFLHVFECSISRLITSGLELLLDRLKCIRICDAPAHISEIILVRCVENQPVVPVIHPEINSVPFAFV